ncbi:MAG: VOC family protein [Bacteroidetes bacterium]|nr:VOC family protein [Bacteroidota bacterium]
MRQKLNLITLGVADIAKSKAFYAGLGWQAHPKSMDDLILFSLGGILLSLYPREGLAEDIGISSEGHGFGGITLAINTHSKEEVDAVLAEIAPLGGTVVKPAQEVFWGGYSGYFRDLDGHLFEVAYNPFWPLDDAGNVILD